MPLYSNSTATLDQYAVVAQDNKFCNFDASLTDRSMSVAIYHISLFGNRWALPLGPGISVRTAIALTAAFITLPVLNLYRYHLDTRRVNGVKKEKLFI